MGTTRYKTTSKGKTVSLKDILSKDDDSSIELKKRIENVLSDEIEIESEEPHIETNIAPKFIQELDRMIAEKTTEKNKIGDTILDSIDFLSGNNTLKICFIRKDNRTYQIKIFINDSKEIRPMTYHGAVSGKSFWELLKNSLKG